MEELSVHQKNERRILSPLGLRSNACAYNVAIDKKKESFDGNLASLLFAHSYGIPMVIHLASPHDNSWDLATKVSGVFHCIKCFDVWRCMGDLIRLCDETPQLIQGPSIPLNIRDSVNLIDILCWSKKFANSSVENALPLLRKATSEEERYHILKSIIEINHIMASEGHISIRNYKHNLRLQKENKHLAVVTAQDYRNFLFYGSKAMQQLDSSALRFPGKLIGKINVVGMQCTDGCFYPGFFSKVLPDESSSHNDQSKKSTEILSATERGKTVMSGIKRKFLSLYDGEFVATGKIDDDGCYHSSEDDSFSLNTISFPTLRAATNAQNFKLPASKKVEENTENNSDSENEVEVKVIKYSFSLQNDRELKLDEIFASGVWYQDENLNECFIAGVFNSEGQFRASYSITHDGYLVFGTTNDIGKYIPLSQYVDGDNIMPTFEGGELTEKQQSLLERLLSIPNLPKAADISKAEHKECWSCVVNGAIVKDSAFLTLLSDEVLDSMKDLKVYAGGELSPSGQLFLYGKYSDKREFLPGGPPVRTDDNLKCLKKDSTIEHIAMDNFFAHFCIRLEMNWFIEPKAKSVKEADDNDNISDHSQPLSDYGLSGLYMDNLEYEGSIGGKADDINDKAATLRASIENSHFKKSKSTLAAVKDQSLQELAQTHAEKTTKHKASNAREKTAFRKARDASFRKKGSSEAALEKEPKKKRSSVFGGKPPSTNLPPNTNTIVLSPIGKLDGGAKKRNSVDALSKKLNLGTIVEKQRDSDRKIRKGRPNTNPKDEAFFKDRDAFVAFSGTRKGTTKESYRRVYNPNLSIKEALTPRKSQDSDVSESSRSRINFRKIAKKKQNVSSESESDLKNLLENKQSSKTNQKKDSSNSLNSIESISSGISTKNSSSLPMQSKSSFSDSRKMLNKKQNKSPTMTSKLGEKHLRHNNQMGKDTTVELEISYQSGGVRNVGSVAVKPPVKRFLPRIKKTYHPEFRGRVKSNKDRFGAGGYPSLNKDFAPKTKKSIHKVVQVDKIVQKAVQPLEKKAPISGKLEATGLLSDKNEVVKLLQEAKSVDNDDDSYLDFLFEDNSRKASSRSAFLPQWDDYTILNFTKNFRFSYFDTVPDHVKEHNKKMTLGDVVLPEIESQRQFVKSRDSNAMVSSNRRLPK